MKTIAVVCQKGGVGKTTTAVNLAVTAAIGHRKTIIIDLDPQRSAAKWWDARETDSPQLLEAGAGQVTEALALAERQGFEIAVLDTPPHAEPIISAAIKASDLALIPCQPSVLDMQAASDTVSIVQRTKTQAAFLLTRCPSTMKRPEEARRGLAVYGLPIAPVVLPELVAFQDAWPFGQGVTEYEPNGKASERMLELWVWVSKRLNKQGALTNG